MTLKPSMIAVATRSFAAASLCFALAADSTLCAGPVHDTARAGDLWDMFLLLADHPENLNAPDKELSRLFELPPCRRAFLKRG